MSNLRLKSDLSKLGLRTLGQCDVDETDDLPAGHSILLVGPDEPAFWAIFTASPEYSDGFPDPLDRWSKRVLTALASGHTATAYFPSDGPPFRPFFTWAKRTGQFWASPISFLVHETAGLFASFRGALLLPQSAPPIAAAQPCLTCAAPCATACPVDAFADGYDVASCKAHLATPAGHDCMTQGCRARRACPVGQGTRLPAQAAFHMKAFL